ncbi:hypothetical protein Csa_018899 [Cucumis sativus]|nr:hypothetical protein Csa_018899 [Cucumis sativus]
MLLVLCISIAAVVEFKRLELARELDLVHKPTKHKTVGVRDDEAKINNAPTFLRDAAQLWWRRRYADQNGNAIQTWEQFKAELRKHFVPHNAEMESRAKLRRLRHTGNILDYVKEFTTIMLKISDLPEKEALFQFRDGLKDWAKVELNRRNVQTLDDAIAAVEMLVHKGLIRRYEGPFSTIERVGKAAYRLELPPGLKIHNVFHMSMLKPFYEDKEDPSRGESSRAPTGMISDFNRKIKEILAERKIRRRGVPNNQTDRQHLTIDGDALKIQVIANNNLKQRVLSDSILSKTPSTQISL